MMTDDMRQITVGRDDTLWKIAQRNGFTVEQVAAANPQLKDVDELQVGQHLYLPRGEFSYTLRFINLQNAPPVGIRFQVLIGKRSVAAGSVSQDANEASFEVSDGDMLTLKAQGKGDAALFPVLHIPVERTKPVIVVRINTAKFTSKTQPHPVAPTVPAPKPTTPSRPAPPPRPDEIDQGLPTKPSKNSASQPEHQIVPGECACDMDLTIDQLAAIFPSRKKADLEIFLSPINSMLSSYGINTCLRKSHALAQIGHESGALRYLAEILPKGKKEAEVYDGYKGRGLIQLTWKTNYEKYGNYKKVNFLDANKIKLESIEYGTDSAGWFLCHGKGTDLNKEADRNDLLLISARVNGGYNGLDDRIAIFKRAHKALLAPACKTPGNRSAVYLPFEKSTLYGETGAVFGWAWWHDAGNKLTGVEKDGAVAKSAYARFLVLNTTNKLKKPRFNFETVAAMVKYATDKSQ